MPRFLSSMVQDSIQLTTKLNSKVDNTHPCLTPVLTSNMMSLFPNAARETFIVAFNDVDKAVWDTIRDECFPKRFPMHTIKCFTEINEIDVDVSLPFCTLFNDILLRKYVVNTSSAFSKTSLFLLQVIIDSGENSFIYDFG